MFPQDQSIIYLTEERTRVQHGTTEGRNQNVNDLFLVDDLKLYLQTLGISS